MFGHLDGVGGGDAEIVGRGEDRVNAVVEAADAADMDLVAAHDLDRRRALGRIVARETSVGKIRPQRGTDQGRSWGLM